MKRRGGGCEEEENISFIGDRGRKKLGYTEEREGGGGGGGAEREWCLG